MIGFSREKRERLQSLMTYLTHLSGKSVADVPKKWIGLALVGTRFESYDR